MAQVTKATERRRAALLRARLGPCARCASSRWITVKDAEGVERLMRCPACWDKIHDKPAPALPFDGGDEHRPE